MSRIDRAVGGPSDIRSNIAFVGRLFLVWALVVAVGSTSAMMGKAATPQEDEVHVQPPRPEKSEPAKEEPVILTPPAPLAPRINGSSIYGVRPGSPFLYRIPCTGARPLGFQAIGLPDGLTLDAARGFITGKIAAAGKHVVTLSARNSHGEAQREFRIVAGDTLALTPPMGWNSWYIHYDRVSDVLMRQAADQMVASGMADYGYQYVNIDDCWMKKRGDEPYRDAAGAVLPNAKFPDMKGLADYIHNKGLKAGLYTSPGPWTCKRIRGCVAA